MRPRSDMRQTAPRVLLGLAAVAIMFAAADTYVVVLALPDMMTTVGLDLDQLQRAAPIVSGFLLGYVAVLPLIGRISDLRGRVPVLLGCLIVFAVGSVITAAAYDLPSIVTGRLIQGIGGGGLIPPTLPLVAARAPRPPPRHRRCGSGAGQRRGAAVRRSRAVVWVVARHLLAELRGGTGARRRDGAHA